METIRAIREYPGLEKVNALNGVADWYEGKGDRAGAQSIYREALRCLQAKIPPDAQRQMGKAKKLWLISVNTFVDFEYELEPAELENHRQLSVLFLCANLGDIEQAAKIGRSMPPGMRQVSLANLAGNLARKGHVAEAMKLAAGLDTAQDRLRAYDLMAIAIRDGRTGQ